MSTLRVVPKGEDASGHYRLSLTSGSSAKATDLAFDGSDTSGLNPSDFSLFCTDVPPDDAVIERSERAWLIACETRSGNTFAFEVSEATGPIAQRADDR
jgi:hypothetical protein